MVVLFVLVNLICAFGGVAFITWFGQRYRWPELLTVVICFCFLVLVYTATIIAIPLV